MKLNSGEFETDSLGGTFDIYIRQDSDVSVDGGYTFEGATNMFELDKGEALALIEELQHFVKDED